MNSVRPTVKDDSSFFVLKLFKPGTCEMFLSGFCFIRTNRIILETGFTYPTSQISSLPVDHVFMFREKLSVCRRWMEAVGSMAGVQSSGL